MPRACCLALGFALAASHPATANITLSARVWNGVSWGPSLVTDGALIPRIQIGIFAAHTNAAAIAAVNYNIVGTESRTLFAADRTVDIVSAGLGRQSPFTVNANAVSVFFPSPAGFRIDDATDAGDSPALSILSAQAPPFNPVNDVLIYRFDFVPSFSLTAVLVTVTPGQVSALEVPIGGGAPQPAVIGQSNSASITFVPSPPSAAVAGGLLLLAARRRRSRLAS